MMVESFPFAGTFPRQRSGRVELRAVFERRVNPVDGRGRGNRAEHAPIPDGSIAQIGIGIGNARAHKESVTARTWA